MGWWGQFIYYKPSMREVRECIEKDTGMTVKSLRFGYAICVVDDEAIAKNEHWQKNFIAKGINPKNYILIALWRYSGNELMIKQVSEDMGPAQLDVPLKYVNAECELMRDCKFAKEWRQKVRDYHIRRKQALKLMNSLKEGDKFYVYGDEYSFKYKKNSNWCIAENLVEHKRYRIRPMQISLTT